MKVQLLNAERYLTLRGVHHATNQWDPVDACNLCAPGATREVALPLLRQPRDLPTPSHM